MAPIEPGDNRWPARKERLLHDVYRRGQALNRQRWLRRGLAGAVAVALVAFVPSVVAGGSGGRHRHVSAAGEPSPTVDTTPETTAAPETTTSTPAVGPSTTAAAAPTTTTSLVCRNSYNPRCGPSRWDPQPTNQPLLASVSYTPSNPKTGETVTFHVHGSDGDAPQIGPAPCAPVDFGAGDPISCMIADYLACPNPPHGPWTPPPATAGRYDHDYPHVYKNPGTFTAAFNLASGTPGLLPPCFTDPYENGATASLQVTVTGPPVTTTSSTTSTTLIG